MRHYREYVALPANDLLQLHNLVDNEPRRSHTSRGYFILPVTLHPTVQPAARTEQPNRFIAWATVCIAFSTLLSFTITLVDFGLLATSGSPPRTSTIRTVGRRRPNQYMNLDRILAGTNLTIFNPIFNFPSVTLQILNSDSHRRMHEDGKGRPTKFGTVYPDDRHVLVSYETSTIVQFRHLDYRMEQCMLHFQVPQPIQFFDPKANITEGSHVEVWILDAPTELSRYIPGSMEFAPTRKSLLTTFRFSSIAHTQFGMFFCPSGGFTMLELTCTIGTMPCHVDFWQDQRAKPQGGLYITQYASSDQS
ncbi:hypothetical protein BD310DRAFT_890241 [Dichomitus squalens]|uniref:Ubiquitin 3 binding protein But2 C-terminal domain-containing protein n=1 Tax=Dichomitus squalens TaxID=114155 RepID=A0A4Q9PGX9_9APHY|nr:hypothetical protein BD310DRAFT_890241 [Dichomitus squalens]